jgi:C1A family cysteine protease
MKLLVVAALFALVAANDFALFNDFVIKYEKRYDSLDEFNHRFAIFQTNLRRIAEMNAQQGKENFGINGLADLSREEFVNTRVMKNLPYRAPNLDANANFNVTGPATIVDWRTKGVITPVKDQGNCGSCWAHSADEATESFYAIKYGVLNVLSVQQCTACTYDYNGCNGGWPYNAYISGIDDRLGIELDSAYPYNIAMAGVCQLAGGVATNPKADDSGYTSPKAGQLQTMLDSTGPVSVCLAAESWQYYTGGVLSSCPGSVDHCVQAVGYNSAPTNGWNPYWIVRNSWGVDWGYAGYIYLDMTVPDICYIQDYMTYPTSSVAP